MDKVTGGSLPVVIWHDFTERGAGQAPEPARCAAPAAVRWWPAPARPRNWRPRSRPPAAAPQEESGIGGLLNTILGGGNSDNDSSRVDAQPAE